MTSRMIALVSVLLAVFSLYYFFAADIRSELYRLETSNESITQAQQKQPLQKQIHLSTLNELTVSNVAAPIVDLSGGLGYFSHQVKHLLSTFRQDYLIDLQLVILNAERDDIDSLSHEIFTLRNIGSDASFQGRGILLLVNQYTAEAKIEVSANLEGDFTDAIVGRIVKAQLAPYASYDMLGMALMDTLHFMNNYLLRRIADGQYNLDYLALNSEKALALKTKASQGAGARTDFSTWKPLDHVKNDDPRFLPSANPLESVESFIAVGILGVSNPDLPLYTTTSQIALEHYPSAPFEQYEQALTLQSAKPFTLTVNGNYAVVSSDQPPLGFYPVLLKKVDGYWRVDMAELWKNLQFDAQGNNFLANNRTPYRFGLAQFGYGRDEAIDRIEIDDKNIRDEIASLKNDDSAYANFKLGEIYFRNAFAAMEAFEHYSRALELAPKDPYFISTIADRYRYVSLIDGEIDLLKRLGWSGQFRLMEAYRRNENYSGIIEVSRQILERNPYDTLALDWQIFASKSLRNDQLLSELQTQKASIEKQRLRKDRRPLIRFSPHSPVYHRGETIDFNGTEVFGYSQFTISIENTSNEAIEILSMRDISEGTAGKSGVGDIKGGFNYDNQHRKIAPGKTVAVQRTEGFLSPSLHERLSYRFQYCWKGLEQQQKQCDEALLHLATKS